jgi:hypothetical protein
MQDESARVEATEKSIFPEIITNAMISVMKPRSRKLNVISYRFEIFRKYGERNVLRIETRIIKITNIHSHRRKNDTGSKDFLNGIDFILFSSNYFFFGVIDY